ncbi:LamG-like jellyroll fold domain-containing protein [Actinoplanes sp. NPDC049802]|uniref:LamG-like jellyroll fold domain-containing protein n=1 Tax=Actinoplanes sp. NPDC049802 TaxID=3154742 RepID=UPI0033F3FE05
MKMFAALSAVLLAPLFGAPAFAAEDPAGPALVARYTFDGGATAGKVNDLSGRGGQLTIRGANNGQIAIMTQGAGRFASFPGICAANAPTCAKALFEAPDDADLDPGTRNFRWAASVRLTSAQISGNANVMQKGVATADSQWKLQIGKTGRAQCVIVARGTGQSFVARSARPVADGNWHRVVCERAGSTLAISVDGVAGAKTTLPTTAAVDNNLPMRIGGPNFAKDSDMYHGQIDDVYVQLG